MIRKRKEIVGGVRWSQICACGVTGLRIILVLGLCWLCLLGWLGAPGLRGLCRRPRKQPLLWLSWHSREPFLKKLHNPILCFPLSLSLSYSDSFASVAVKDSLSYPHKHISFPLFEILLFFLGDQELVAFRNSGPHTWAHFFPFLGRFPRSWVYKCSLRMCGSV